MSDLTGTLLMDAQTFLAAGMGNAARQIISTLSVIFSCDGSGTELQWNCPLDGAIIGVQAAANAFALSKNVPAVQRVIGAQVVYTDQIISSNTTTAGATNPGIGIYALFKQGDVLRCVMQAGSMNLVTVFVVFFAPLT